VDTGLQILIKLSSKILGIHIPKQSIRKLYSVCKEEGGDFSGL